MIGFKLIVRRLKAKLKVLMASKNTCPFCNPEKVKLELPSKTPCKCKRNIYENESSFAVLCPEQYTVGHSLVIFKKHKSGITDQVDENELCDFMKAIQAVAKLLEDKVRDHRGKSPDKIYACVLSDGIEHLHAHLIPRYPFTERDEATYRKEFIYRDGVIETECNIKNHKLGGFWYIALREREWKNSEFAEKHDKEKAKILEELAEKIRG